jgi:hypothetical protein
MANRVHRPLKVIAFKANGILRQRYKLSKQLRDLHIDVALFSDSHLKPHQRFHLKNYHITSEFTAKLTCVEQVPFSDMFLYNF